MKCQTHHIQTVTTNSMSQYHPNLLFRWQEEMKLVKWKEGLINEPPFNEIDQIVSNLLEVFPEKDFDSRLLNNFKENFIIDLLISNHDHSIYKLAEYSKCIEFLKNHPEKDKLNIFNKSKPNYRELRNRLFELLVNKILVDNGIKTRLSEHYLIADNIKKPLDAAFTFKEKNYLIECKKIYNEKSKSAKEVVNVIIPFHEKLLKSFSAEELIGGFVIFKRNMINAEIKNVAIENLRRLLNKFYSSYRNNNSNTIPANYYFSNDDLEIHIVHQSMFQSELNSKYRDVENMIFFETGYVDHSLEQRIVQAKYQMKINYDKTELVKLISGKIREKKRQHQKALFDKRILVFEFETYELSNVYENSLPVDQKFLDDPTFENYVDEQTAIVFMIYSISKSRIRTEVRLIKDQTFDSSLASILSNLKIKRW